MTTQGMVDCDSVPTPGPEVDATCDPALQGVVQSQEDSPEDPELARVSEGDPTGSAPHLVSRPQFLKRDSGSMADDDSCFLPAAKQAKTDTGDKHKRKDRKPHKAHKDKHRSKG